MQQQTRVFEFCPGGSDASAVTLRFDVTEARARRRRLASFNYYHLSLSHL
jgi:hypothetical protein